MKGLLINLGICLTLNLNTICFLPKANAQPQCQVKLNDGNESYLNVRGTGPSGQVVERLRNGTPISIISIFDDHSNVFKNSWYKVRASNGDQQTVGWVDSSYIDCFNSTATYQDFQTAKPCRRYAETGLYDRPNGKPVSTLRPQTLIYPDSYSQGWVKLVGYTSQGVYQQFGWANKYQIGDCKF